MWLRIAWEDQMADDRIRDSPYVNISCCKACRSLFILIILGLCRKFNSFPTIYIYDMKCIFKDEE